jgi:hypothetical protein
VFTSGAGAAAPLAPGFNGSLAPDVWWLWEGRVGYLLLDRLPGARAPPAAAATPLPSLHVSATVQNGTWAKLGVWQAYTACAVFSAWLEHAPPVAGAAAAYAVVPGVDLAAWAAGGAAAAAANLAILANAPQLQAVLHRGDAALAAVAYEPAAAAAPRGWPGFAAVNLSAPGAFLLRDGGAGNLRLAAAQPAQVPWAANVTLTGRGGGGANCTTVAGDLVFVLSHPTGDGSSVLLTC